MMGIESQRGIAPRPEARIDGPRIDGTRADAPNATREGGFSAALEKAAGELEAAHGVADQRSLDLVMGRDVAVHDVMAAVAEAEIATQMTTAVAVKAIQAYQEIWRMEI